MNKREKIILAITVVVLVFGVTFRMLPEGILSAGLEGGDVASARQTFDDYFDRIKKGPGIREAYTRVNTRLPERLPKTTPEATFSNEVARRLKDRGWERPTVYPPKPSEIKDVDDYYYIDLDVRLTGTLDRVIAVLIDFQQTGLLIKAFQIEKRNMDGQDVEMNVTVARLAKMDETKMRKLKKSSGG